MKLRLFSIVCAAMTAASTWAMPTWMGVYGDIDRHSGDNPGTFTVLMNQDYAGLHAEVGVQVDGSTWTQYEMSYDGNVDGNSKWTFTPASGFPSGSTVTFYFHGFDDWGGNIWDSDNGNNYSFVAQGGNTGVNFGNAVNVGVNGPGGTITDAAVFGDNGIAIAGGGYKLGDLSGESSVWDVSWQSLPGTGSLRSVAVNENSIIAVRNSGNQLNIWRKDGDSAWAGPQVVVSPSSIHSVKAQAFGGSGFVIAYAVSPGSSAYYDARELYTVKSTDNGASWGTPVLVESETRGWYDSLEIGSNASGISIRARYVQQAYATSVKIAQSTDQGASWTVTTMLGDKVGTYATMLVNDAGVFAALSPYYANEIRFARNISGSWETINIPRDAYASGDDIKLGAGPNGSILLFIKQAYPSTAWDIRVSNDNGSNWTPAGAISAPQGVPSHPPQLRQVLSGSGKTHLLWVNGDWRYGSGLWQSSTGAGGPVIPVEWAGNVYHWPTSGNIDSGDNVYINIESYPQGAAVSADVEYSLDGGYSFTRVPMSKGDGIGNNDNWYVDLGTFPAGQTIIYAVSVADNGGTVTWDDNNGQDYTAQVNSVPVENVAREDDGYTTRVLTSSGAVTFHEGTAWIDILVENHAFDKEVGIYWTTDNWDTYEVTTADYVDSLSGNLERWNATFIAGVFTTGPHFRETINVEYAIYYTVNGQTFWDNNHNQNHNIHIE